MSETKRYASEFPGRTMLIRTPVGGVEKFVFSESKLSPSGKLVCVGHECWWLAGHWKDKSWVPADEIEVIELWPDDRNYLLEKEKMEKLRNMALNALANPTDRSGLKTMVEREQQPYEAFFRPVPWWCVVVMFAVVAIMVSLTLASILHPSSFFPHP